MSRSAILVLCAVSAVLSANPAAPASLMEEYKKWKALYNIQPPDNTPANTQADTMMFSNFKRSYEEVMEHNKATPPPLYQKALNQFAGSPPPRGYEHTTSSLSHAPPPRPAAPLATEIDWRLRGAVSPVKNQGDGSTCWSFSAAEAIEGQNVLSAKNPLISLSNQYIIDCIHKGGDSCNTETNTMTMAFDFLKASGGQIYTYASYPYVDGECVFWNPAHGCHINATDKFAPNLYVTGYVHTIVGNETSLMEAVNVGPVAVAIDASSINLYAGGIYNGKCGNTKADLDHAVLVVGYGTDKGVDYWSVKNSWGATWGEQGYLRMIRGKNICGIAEDASYPTVSNKKNSTF